MIRSKLVHKNKHKVLKRHKTMSHQHVISMKCKTIDNCASVCIKCAYVMHVQGMTKHIGVTVSKTHNQQSKHDEHV